MYHNGTYKEAVKNEIISIKTQWKIRQPIKIIKKEHIRRRNLDNGLKE
ncbi:hypothetical protein GDO81_002246 [Engystomops pustulosus]|uniref:Uncharacterized protein n=1 Tax=Engystomops pustulosus TaxID=76066 RepID=A0AAV7DK57_ENGPU|nr:hypothetical protein GDO81_002246 [Engystomops pustulosus]